MYHGALKEADDRAVNGVTWDDIVLFTQQIMPLMPEYKNNINTTLSTQNDAFNTLINSFTDLQNMMQKQQYFINSLTHRNQFKKTSFEIQYAT